MKVDFWETVYKRRSIREYETKNVDRKLLDDILGAAEAAPSVHNSRPWHFYVITSKSEKNSIAREMAIPFEKDLKAQRIPDRTRKIKVADSIKRFTEAPVLIIPCVVVGELIRSMPLEKRLKEDYPSVNWTVKKTYMPSPVYLTEEEMKTTDAVILGVCW